MTAYMIQNMTSVSFDHSVVMCVPTNTEKHLMSMITHNVDLCHMEKNGRSYKT
jgi:hypothetical protein